MVDISVVIVNWNVRELVLRLIRSIQQNTHGVTYEILVMDNASSDGSVAAIRAAYPDVTLIANTQNLGFAKAVNQGIGLSRGRIILVQNPDSELLDDALSAFVSAFDAHPEYGIIGPKLLNTDGTVQDSIRRFPGIIDQTMIALKLHHPLRRTAPIARYLADDFDYSREQEVDQLMGASFAFRRELMEKIGMLDERFFIWYEEVDFMKRARDAGYSVRYLPQIALTHHRGQSFGQVFSVQKQKYFSTSMAQYMQKHFGLLAGAWFWFLRPVSLLLAWSQNAVLRNLVAVHALGYLAAIEVGSLVMQFFPVFALPLLLAFGVSVFVATLQRGLGIGLAALALEFLIGSHGHSITLGLKGEGGLGLRMVLFVAVMSAWLIGKLRMQGMRGLMAALRDLPQRVWLLVGAVVYGVLVALLGGQGLGAVFSDANGYLTLALLLPVLEYARGFQRDDAKVRMGLVGQVLGVGLAWLAVKSLLFTYAFAHLSEPIMRALYVWIRDTRVGEVTLFVEPMYRVFMASQVYLALGIAAMSFGIGFLGLLFAGLIASLSRSFALGLFVGLMVTLGVGLARAILAKRGKEGIHEVGGKVVRMVAGCVLGIAVLAGVVYFPIPAPHGQGSLGTVLLERYGGASDAAASARWALLGPLWQQIQQHPIVGSGFGQTVTYFSPDPYWTAIRPDGMVVTTRFEWGWLDVWLKFGLLGGALYVGYLALLFAAIWRKHNTAALAVLVTLLAIHATTPYLDHPIGLGVLIALEGWLAMQAVGTDAISTPRD